MRLVNTANVVHGGHHVSDCSTVEFTKNDETALEGAEKHVVLARINEVYALDADHINNFYRSETGYLRVDVISL